MLRRLFITHKVFDFLCVCVCVSLPETTYSMITWDGFAFSLTDI